MTSGMHRRPFEGRHLVLKLVKIAQAALNDCVVYRFPFHMRWPAFLLKMFFLGKPSVKLALVPLKATKKNIKKKTYINIYKKRIQNMKYFFQQL